MERVWRMPTDRYIVERHLYGNCYEITHADELGRALVIYKGYYNADSNYFKLFPHRLIDKRVKPMARVISGFETERREHK